MSNIFFTADLHFGHANIIKYCNRPFSNVDDMNTKLIHNWNSVVGKEDTIYVAGDLTHCCSISNATKILAQLNGNIILIPGCHDIEYNTEHKSLFASIADKILTINIPSTNKNEYPTYITISHYSLRTWPASHYNSWCLFGHSHGQLPPFGKSFDVGVDAHNYMPWSISEVIDKMKSLEDNFNLVKPK